MKRSVLSILAVVILVTVSLHAATDSVLLPVRRGSTWGYIDRTGRIVPRLQGYLSAAKFSEGLALVSYGSSQNPKWGYIDSTGRIVLEVGPGTSGFFHDGLLKFTAGAKVGYMTKTGKVVVAPRYSLASGDFHEGMASVTAPGTFGKSGFIDRTGKVVIPMKYDAAMNFSEGLAGVMVNHKWGYIDHKGKVVIQPQFDGADDFSEGLAVVTVEQVYYTSKKTGKVDPDVILDFGKGGYIDRTGAFVFPPRRGLSSSFSEGLAAASVGDDPMNSKWGYIDRTGEFVIQPRYLMAEDFSEGLAAVTVGSWESIKETGSLPKSGYIDKAGKMVIEVGPGVFAGGAFSHGIARFLPDGFPGQDSGPSYITKSGKVIWTDR